MQNYFGETSDNQHMTFAELGKKAAAWFILGKNAGLSGEGLGLCTLLGPIVDKVMGLNLDKAIVQALEQARQEKAEQEKAKELGLEPMAAIRAYASSGLDPAYMGLGPVPATKKALKVAGLGLKDIDVVELNEAFASQAIAVVRELGLDLKRTNPHGSGISLGHPIGCTGARILVTLIHEMLHSNLQFGLATLCIGGGQGMALVIERKPL